MIQKILILMLFSFISFISVANETFAVIVNVQNTQAISKSLIKNISSDIVSTWDNGHQIRIFLPKANSETRRNFALAVLKISAKQDTRNWENRKITNTLNNKMPKILREKMIIRMVAKYPNAIGFVSPSLARKNPKVKVVLEQ